jgi:hypothetical protein
MEVPACWLLGMQYKDLKMSHFAQIDENNIVTRVLVIDHDQIMTGAFGDPATWIQTSYNTREGVHLSGGTPLRKNYAGIGFSYDSERDAFIPPKPFASWQLDEFTCSWVPPIAKPEGLYSWDESTCSWYLETFE